MQRDFDYYLEKLAIEIKKSGLKKSTQREMVLKVLFDSTEHLTPEQILFLLKEQQSNIGIATVYRTLSFLEKAQFVHAIQVDNGKKYELDRGEHHDHMICIKCSGITEFFNKELEDIQERITNEYEFEAMEHSLTIYGVCKTCNS